MMHRLSFLMDFSQSHCVPFVDSKIHNHLKSIVFGHLLVLHERTTIFCFP